jgi:hypothetical protein
MVARRELEHVGVGLRCCFHHAFLVGKKLSYFVFV